MVLLGRPAQRLLDAAGDQARSLRSVRGHLLRRPVGQPGGVRPHRRARHRAGPGGRAGPPLPAVRAALRRADLRGPGLRARVDRGVGDGGAVEQLDPVPPRRQLQRDRPPVPQGHRLLRLRPAVHDLRRGLDAGHPDRHVGRLGRVPLLQRRDPAPAGPAPGAPSGEGAHLGAARADRAGQGGRLRPAALFAGQRAGRLRQRRRLHRCARPPAGGDRCSFTSRSSPPSSSSSTSGARAGPSRCWPSGSGPSWRWWSASSTRRCCRRSRSRRRRARWRRRTSSATSRPPGTPTA